MTNSGIPRSSSLDYCSLEQRRVLTTFTLADGHLRMVGTNEVDRVELVDDSLSSFVRAIDLVSGDFEDFAKEDVLRIEFWGLGGDDELDVLQNSASSNRAEYFGFYGGEGNDRLYTNGWLGGVFTGIGGPGDDVMISENDVTGSTGPQVSFFGGAGNDELTGGIHDDLLVGNGGDDLIFGSLGEDRIFGGEGNDILNGGAASDEVVGGPGDDNIHGGFEETAFVSDCCGSGTAPDGENRLVGGTGDDTISIGRGGGDIVLGGSGKDTIIGESEFSGSTVYAGPDDDIVDIKVDQTHVPNNIFGQEGNDRLIGTSGDDVMRGGPGDDTLFGLGGADQLFGEGGNDELFGGEGDDTLYGFTGDDTLNGFDGDDLLYAGFGNDLVVGGAGNDVLGGFDGDDVLLGNDGNDRLLPGVGLDYAHGGNGDDFLLGDVAPKRLVGGPGIDIYVKSLDHSIDYVKGEDILRPNVLLVDFLGLTEEKAVALAESLDRQWCVFRIGDPPGVKGAVYVPRRLRFVVEDGFVISVRTESGEFASSAS